MTADSDSNSIATISCSGGAHLMGHSISHESIDVKRSIGFVPQEITLSADLTAREFEFLEQNARITRHRSAAASRRNVQSALGRH